MCIRDRLYGVVIALALAAASRRLTPRDNAVVLALSLLLSFLIGEAIVALTDPLPTGDISNPLMFALSSIFLVILGHIGCDAPKAPLPSRLAPSLSGRAAVPATALLLCYLLGSGAFMSLSSVARGETWFSDGWIHCAFALEMCIRDRGEGVRRRRLHRGAHRLHHDHAGLGEGPRRP